MPMINGRFYMNPGLGTALERARAQATAAPMARGGEIEIDHAAPDGNTAASEPGTTAPSGRDEEQFAGPAHPVHRVEIEAANGKFLAKLLRQHPGPAGANADASAATGGSGFGGDLGSGSMGHAGGAASVTRQAGLATPHEELHVFSHHQDLLNFLKQELERHV
jgi:hypothetical protein